MQSIEYLFVCTDSKDSASRRGAALQAHQSYIEAMLDRIRVAGPLLSEDGVVVGSAYLVAARSADDAWRLITADPFHTAGVWHSIAMHRMYAAAGSLLGGVGWEPRGGVE